MAGDRSTFASFPPPRLYSLSSPVNQTARYPQHHGWSTGDHGGEHRVEHGSRDESKTHSACLSTPLPSMYSHISAYWSTPGSPEKTSTTQNYNTPATLIEEQELESQQKPLDERGCGREKGESSGSGDTVADAGQSSRIQWRRRWWQVLAGSCSMLDSDSSYNYAKSRYRMSGAALGQTELTGCFSAGTVCAEASA